MLHHGIDDRMFAQEQIFDFIPALERHEGIDVLQEKILPLYCARLR